jgi:hypothetical protein
MQIIVLTNGWVFYGILDNNTITDASVVRIWGTKNGIGDLANGPTPDTVLDPIPTPVTFNPDQLLFSFNSK